MIDLADTICTIERRRDYALACKKADRDLSTFTLSDACREVGESVEAMQRATVRGNPTILTISRLALVLGVRLDWLLGGGDLHQIIWTPGELIND